MQTLVKYLLGSKGSLVALILAQRVVGADDILTTAAKGWNFDQPIPASPAFTALGLAPETVTHPATPRELGTSLLNGVDNDGKLQSGVAIDAAPYQLFFLGETSLSDYRDSRLVRLLYNTQLSVATAKIEEKDGGGLRLAAGLQITILNKADLRMDTTIDSLIDKYNEKNPIYESKPGDSDEMISFKARLGNLESLTSLKKVVDEIRKNNWAATSMHVAASPVWKTTTGKVNELHSDGMTYWGTYAWGFDGIKPLKARAQYLLHARYHNGESVMDQTTSNASRKKDTVFIANRLRLGRADLHFSIEAGWIEEKRRGMPSVKIQRIGGSAEFRVKENLWLVVSAGNNVVQSGNKEGGAYTLAGLRFGTSESAGINLGK